MSPFEQPARATTLTRHRAAIGTRMKPPLLEPGTLLSPKDNAKRNAALKGSCRTACKPKKSGSVGDDAIRLSSAKGFISTFPARAEEPGLGRRTADARAKRMDHHLHRHESDDLRACTAEARQRTGRRQPAEGDRRGGDRRDADRYGQNRREIETGAAPATLDGPPASAPRCGERHRGSVGYPQPLPKAVITASLMRTNRALGPSAPTLWRLTRAPSSNNDKASASSSACTIPAALQRCTRRSW